MKEIRECRKGGRNLVEYLNKVFDYKAQYKATNELEEGYEPIVLELLFNLLVELRLLRMDSFLLVTLLAGQLLLTLLFGILGLFLG